MTDQIGSGTAKGLIEYLDSLIEKGRGPKGAISPLKIAFSQVLRTVDGDGWGATNIREIDVDDYGRRFGNLTMGRYTDDSLRIYVARVKKVVKWYETFLSNPGWAPEFRATKAKQDTKAPKFITTPTIKATDDSPARDEQPEMPTKTETVNDQKPSGLVAYPFPLANGGMATLYLPSLLQKTDAVRMAAFLQTLVLESDE